ncbi:MAG: radical SAM family protein [Bacillota bacterium]|nr:MAG: radical SAM family protein [Bacillota bacterium]MBS3950242.1 TIGR03960 family B12-binding radical SAM protein [Peptococcaceae bacterium]
MIPKNIRRLLPQVQKPARYTGGEVNAVMKDLAAIDVRIALAFPDTYEVGMSHLGLKILYKVVNDIPYAYAERVFAPWVDMGGLMQTEGVPLFSLETYSPLHDFDMIGVTLQYEMSYTNILYMLDLAQIPFLTHQRTESDPLIIAGGPCAFNAEPLAEMLDAVALGEGEEVTQEIVSVLLERKLQKLSRQETLQRLALVPGVYVPSLYSPEYNGDDTLKALQSISIGTSNVVKKRILSKLTADYIPTAPVVPYTDIVHDRIMIEIFRGCARGCRFCQAGMIYRPVREYSSQIVLEAAEESIKNTGYEEVSLSSLSTMDYSSIETTLPMLVDKLSCQGVNVSLPSLRVDSFSVEMAAQVARLRKSGLTLAPEAGSQRLRDVINKQVSAEDLLQALRGARRLGFKSAKLYFMIGLPTETIADLDEMVDLVTQAAGIMPVTVSTSSFVPKPHTPFQWEPQFSMYELETRQRYLKERFRRDRRVKYNYHDASTSFLEAIFSRGDRRLSKVLLEAYKRGCKFDGWSEHFKFKAWMDAFAECGLDPTFYANRVREEDEVFPWDHLSPGLDKSYLYNERAAALKAEWTVDCAREHCPSCGVCPNLGVQTFTEKERR